MFSSFLLKPQSRKKSFVDLPAKEKKKIIVEAVRGSNKMQADLVKRYDLQYKLTS